MLNAERAVGSESLLSKCKCRDTDVEPIVIMNSIQPTKQTLTLSSTDTLFVDTELGTSTDSVGTSGISADGVEFERLRFRTNFVGLIMAGLLPVEGEKTFGAAASFVLAGAKGDFVMKSVFSMLILESRVLIVCKMNAERICPIVTVGC